MNGVKRIMKSTVSTTYEQTDDMTSMLDCWPVNKTFYRGLLINHLQPNEICLEMKIADGCWDAITGKTENNENREASELLLRHIDGTCNAADQSGPNTTGLDGNRGEVSNFFQALKKVQPYLYETIKGNGEKIEHEDHKNIIRYFTGDIIKQLDPIHICPHLIAKKLLSTDKEEMLIRICEQKGPKMGTIFLVGNIHRSGSQTWYSEFLEILLDSGYSELVELIDKIEYQKKMSQREYKLSETHSSPDLIVSGAAHQPSGKSYHGCTSTQEANNLNAFSEDEEFYDAEETLLKSERDIHRFYNAEETLLKSERDIHSLPVTIKMTDTQDKHDEIINTNRNIANEIIKPVINKHASEMNILECTVQNDADNSNAEVDGPLEDVEMYEVGKPIDLREYQQELTEEALQGKNVIVCAPTGSGKTHVALKIIKEHLDKRDSRIRKVVFLVNQVALADQQYNQCLEHLKPYRCRLISGTSDGSDGNKTPLLPLLERSQVLVMTAQILLDALDHGELQSICQLSLLVFDECHHTHQRHPFNCIMHHYMAAKLSQEATDSGFPQRLLPQVVGMTASVGVGKAKQQSDAIDYIRRLCAHLDADFISTVRCHRDQLAQFSNSPRYELKSCLPRENDTYREIIERMMRKIELTMEKSGYAYRVDAETGIVAKLHAPAKHGTKQYTIWISQLQKEISLIVDAETRQFLSSCRRMLQFYNTSLIINEDCRTRDALLYLEEELKKLFDSIGIRMKEVDLFLKELFEKNKPYLEEVSRDPLNKNHKLTTMEAMLVKAFDEEPETRAIIFVETRDLASAILTWMNETPRLKAKKPGKMVGAGAGADKGGMTKNQQVDVIDYFRQGDHHILVATSVAQEGLDISKCNLVINYDYVTNEIAMVQARGRARAENSQFVTVASQGRGVQEKEEINLIREQMMHRAIHVLQQEMTTRFAEYCQCRENIQLEEKSKRDQEIILGRRKKREGEVELRCIHCDQIACMSSDIRTIRGTHHVVIDKSFRERCNERPHPKPIKIGDDEFKQGKLSCRACGKDWGIVILHSNTRLPIIKIESFIVIDQYDNRDAPKKWKNVHFAVQEMTASELMTYRRETQATVD